MNNARPDGYSHPPANSQLGHLQAPEDCFSCDPEVLFEQASGVALSNLGTDNAGNIRWFLAFFRSCPIPAPDGYTGDAYGMRWGVEVAAYRANDEGEVQNWERRYEVQGVSADHALSKLRFQLANGLATLSSSELSTLDLIAGF